MKISIIVAHGKNREIGLNGSMPWHLPGDFKHFKKQTMGHPLVMGRKTYESIGRPLPGRTTYAVSRQDRQSTQGLFWFDSLKAALEAADNEQNKKCERLFILGGGHIYEQALPLAQELFITEVDYSGPADTYFPSYDKKDFALVQERKDLGVESDQYPWTFKRYERIA